MTLRLTGVALALLLPGTVQAQGSESVAGKQSSANIHVMSHIPLARPIADIEVEQELNRPYAYLSGEQGFVVVSMKDVTKARVIYEWHIENPELHKGS